MFSENKYCGSCVDAGNRSPGNPKGSYYPVTDVECVSTHPVLIIEGAFMATMIPKGVEQFTTDGERQVYHFLESVAKPDFNYIVWYSPDILGREPDFILYNDVIGLLILEVKDWAIDQILEADKKDFKLHISQKQEVRKNPYQQAQEYMYSCIEAIENDGTLLSTDSAHHGKSKIPVNCGVVLTNINNPEFREKGLGKVLDEKKIFFWEDLHPGAPMSTDRSGNEFHSFLTSKFTPRFNFQLTGKEKLHLKQLIFPVVKIEQPRKCSVADYATMETRLSALDHHQESFAKKYDGGHRILKGPSGSGKTLILINKAYFLKRYNPQINNILFVCYNITLVNYIRRMLAEKKIPFGEKGVEVYHFFELCGKLLDEKIEYEEQDGDYYQLVLEEASHASENHKKYDAILVDEGQDFSDDMLRVAMNLLNPKTGNLTIALDENQNIYSKKRSWKEIGVNARGRTHSLDYTYRSTKELTRFANNFISGEKESSSPARPLQREMFPDFFAFTGPPPFLKQFSDIAGKISFIGDEIDTLAGEHGYPLSEIAVLYATSRIPGEGQQYVIHFINEAFSERGILFNWISEDYRGKKSYDITTDSVTVSTVHSAKGFDYAALFVVGLDWLEGSRWSDREIERLTYVAITRARYRLYIPFVRETKTIQQLRSCIKKFQKEA